MRIVCAISGMFGSLSLTLALFNSPDYGKGKTSALKVFNMIDSAQEGKPDSSVQDGSRDIAILFNIANIFYELARCQFLISNRNFAIYY